MALPPHLEFHIAAVRADAQAILALPSAEQEEYLANYKRGNTAQLRNRLNQIVTVCDGLIAETIAIPGSIQVQIDERGDEYIHDLIEEFELL